MKAIEMKKDIYWVGAIDWDLRNFHGYLTQRGSTYNSYLIMDEKITLIDNVKIYLKNQLMERVSSIVEVEKIDYIVQNHIEMDHSGSIVEMMKIAKNAKVFATQKAIDALKKHFPNIEQDRLFPIDEIKELSLGKRTLTFVPTAMVHWPDNMVSYCKEEKILFSNDAFGQHIASYERFDDQYSLDIIREESKKYYANIVLPYHNQVKKALNAVKDLPIEIIAPSHGIIWRKNIAEIIELYKTWANGIHDEKKAVIIYDTMWNSTKSMAETIANALENKAYSYELLFLQTNHISDIITKIIDAKYIFIGSPTLNNQILPTVSAFLTYLIGLSPQNKTYMAFGSYGWGGQSVKIIEDSITKIASEILPSIRIQYVPSKKDLNELQNKIEELI